MVVRDSSASHVKVEVSIPVPVRHKFKREDCKRTKHDSDFSEWKILVGPSDWTDYHKGKEGLAKYRVHNLPGRSGPGVYELGIAVSHSGLGREIGKLDPELIVVVYLGQADNVRVRLQRYGRTGAHLGNALIAGDSDSTKGASLQNGPGLFEEIFSKGYPIVYRWAPMESKIDAEKTETQLLRIFDYAWNTTKNGSRRPDDVLQKLNKLDSAPVRFPKITKMLLPFTQKEVGVKIKSVKPIPQNNRLCTDTEEGRYSFLPRIFNFNRSRPRIVLQRTNGTEENGSLCGVALGSGSVCTRPTVKGRKRCPQHKGIRINSSVPLLKREMRECNSDVKSISFDDRKSDGQKVHDFRDSVEENPNHSTEYPLNEKFIPICGFILDDSSPCSRQPTKGRKRCSVHKGRKVRSSVAN